jgi:hypothetical protein
MEGISVWLLSAFRKRMDVLGQRFRRNIKQFEERKQVSETFDRLSQTFSAEQFKLFLEWEEQTNEKITKEKEQFYLHGISDGFQLYMSMDEFTHFTNDDQYQEQGKKQ